MDTDLGTAIADLYRATREVPATAFQDWAFERCKALVPFDCAIWGRAGMESGLAQIYSVHLHRLPPESLQSYARFKDRDVIGRAAMGAMGTTLAFSASAVVEPEMLEQHVRRFGLEHSLSTCSVDPRTALVSFVTLFRPEHRTPFTEEERRAKQAQMPHLVESCHQSRLMQLASGSMRERGARETAACDADMVLIAARADFIERLRAEWPQWSGPRMPADTWNELRRGGRGRVVGKRVTLSFQRVSDLYWLSARERAPADSLAPRQVQIARMTAGGMTNKEIARELSVAPLTVRNHLDAIYRKLAIGSRAELAARLAELE